MALYFRLAFRNLWRNKRRTFITMSAMAFATALLVWMLGGLEGYMRDALESATGLYTGHAKVTAQGYLAERDPLLTLPAASIPAVESGMRGVSGRVRGYALLSCGREDAAQTQPAELLGVDPAQEERVSGLSKRVVKGADLDGVSTHGILLGRTLAHRLGAAIGSEVVAMSQAVDGSTAPELFRVAGLIDTGETHLDASLALVGRATLQAMLGLEGRVHEWVVAFDDPAYAVKWAAPAQARMPDVAVNSWHTLLPALARLIDMMAVFKWFAVAIFYFGVVLVTVNTMYMAQLERLREFAVMGAIGLRRLRLMSLIVIEGAMMSTIAALVGGVLGAAASFFTMTHPLVMASSSSSISMAGASASTAMRSVPTVESFTLPILTMVLLGGLISLFPALKLGRLRPVDALREV